MDPPAWFHQAENKDTLPSTQPTMIPSGDPAPPPFGIAPSALTQDGNVQGNQPTQPNADISSQHMVQVRPC